MHCYSRPRAPHPKYVKKASPPLQMVACLTRDHHGVQYWTKMQDVCTYLYSWWRLWHRLGSKVPICVPTGPGIFRTSKVTLRDPLKHHHIRRVRRGEGIPLEPGGGVWARPKWERLLPLHPVLPGLPSVYSSPSCSFLVLSIKCVDSGSGLGGGAVGSSGGKALPVFSRSLNNQASLELILGESYDFPQNETVL